MEDLWKLYSKHNPCLTAATQLQLVSVTSTLSNVTQMIAGLEECVVTTQRAILAQSQELALARNLSDNANNILNLKFRTLIETDPIKKAQLQEMISVCKSSLVTGKRPEPDRTRTCQDRKLVGPFRTVTAVRSTVQHKSENLKTEQRPVLTGLSSLKVMLALTGLRVCNFY